MQKASERSWLQRTFKLDVVLVFSTLIIVTMTSITAFTYFQNRRETIRLADQIMDHTAQAVIEKTVEHLSPAQTVAQLSAELVANDGAQTYPGGNIERYFKRIVQTHSQIEMIYFGDKAGNFLQARREPGTDNLVTRFIKRDGDLESENYFFWGDNDQVARQTQSENVSYDPRVRPWYAGAVEHQRAFWTDIYIFNTGKVPGITAAYPALSVGGELRGVVGADLSLAQLSAFLEELEISPRGVAFLMDERGQLVAFPGQRTTIKTPEGKLRPLLARELQDPWLTAAVQAYESGPQNRFTYDYEGEQTIGFVSDFPRKFGKPWKTVVLVPVDDFLGPIKRNSAITLGISMLILLAAIYLGLIFARNIARPVEYLTGELNKIKDFHLGDRIEVKSYIHEIQMMGAAINSMKAGLEAFRKYVPAEQVRRVIQSGEPAEPGGQERELSLLFSDIQNFTSIAEDMSARDLMVSLSEYFEVLTAAVSEERGTIDKYIGDSVMAFWGAPLPEARHAQLACRAVLRAERQLAALNSARRARGEVAFETRFGVHSGLTIVGNVGSTERLNYTAMGDSVNLASRLEGVNKHYGTRVLISHSTYCAVQDEFVCRPLDSITVRGRSSDIKIYELLCEVGDVEEKALRELADKFQLALDAYLAHDWQQASARFDELEREYPNDSPSKLFAERSRSYAENPPEVDLERVDSIRMA